MSLQLSTAERIEYSIADKAGKAATSALISAAAMELMYRGTDVDLSGALGQYIGRTPLWAAAGIAAAATSVTADLAHDAITPWIDKDSRFMNVPSSAVALASTGGATIGSYYLMDPKFLQSPPNGVGGWRLLSMAMLAEAGAGIAYDAMKPMMPTVMAA